MALFVICAWLVLGGLAALFIVSISGAVPEVNVFLNDLLMIVRIMLWFVLIVLGPFSLIAPFTLLFVYRSQYKFHNYNYMDPSLSKAMREQKKRPHLR